MQAAPTPTRGFSFVGSYLFQMDEKGRVALPAAFRRATGGLEAREGGDPQFVLIQAYQSSLQLYPDTEWLGVQERLYELRQHQPEARMYVLKLMSSAVEVTPDGQGRILIPGRLKEAAELGGQVLLVGAIDRIEIWNPARFDAEVQASTEGFERFAPQIFR
jgi:MraZ protein